MQLYDWVAEVVESRPIEATATENDLDLTQGMWQTIVYCRNRFYEGDTLELLSPHREVTPVLVVGLEEVFPAVDARDDEGLENPEPKDASASKQNERCFDSNAGAVAIANTTPVEVANKAMAPMPSSLPCRSIAMTSCVRSDAIPPRRTNCSNALRVRCFLINRSFLASERVWIFCAS